MNTALEELKQVPKPSDKNTAKTFANIEKELSEGRLAIADQQKKIRMADRLEFSWGMEEAYKWDELADDSADEKRMEKAEREAERGAKRKRRARRNRWQPYMRQDSGDAKGRPTPPDGESSERRQSFHPQQRPKRLKPW